MNHLIKILPGLIGLALLGAGFQNCSKANFSSTSQTSVMTASGAPTASGPSDAVPVNTSLPLGNVMVLDPTSSQSMTLSGVARVSAHNVIVNSKSDSAVTLSGASNISASQVSIVGNFQVSGVSQVQNSIVGVTPSADPLKDLANPSEAGLVVHSGIHIAANSTAVLTPGIYTDTVTISDAAIVTMNSGTYFFKNGFIVTGAATVRGTDILIYMQGGQLRLSGATHTRLSAATSGPFSGIILFQDRDNTSVAELSGASDWFVKGTVYIPHAKVKLSGVADVPLSINLIVWQIDLAGASFVLGT